MSRGRRRAVRSSVRGRAGVLGPTPDPVGGGSSPWSRSSTVVPTAEPIRTRVRARGYVRPVRPRSRHWVTASTVSRSGGGISRGSIEQRTLRWLVTTGDPRAVERSTRVTHRETPDGGSLSAPHGVAIELPEPAGDSPGPVRARDRSRRTRPASQAAARVDRPRAALPVPPGPGYSYSEMAKLTASSRRTVERQILRGHAKLKHKRQGVRRDIRSAIHSASRALERDRLVRRRFRLDQGVCVESAGAFFCRPAENRSRCGLDHAHLRSCTTPAGETTIQNSTASV
jgi:hypothetical protein